MILNDVTRPDPTRRSTRPVVISENTMCVYSSTFLPARHRRNVSVSTLR